MPWIDQLAYWVLSGRKIQILCDSILGRVEILRHGSQMNQSKRIPNNECLSIFVLSTQGTRSYENEAILKVDNVTKKQDVFLKASQRHAAEQGWDGANKLVLSQLNACLTFLMRRSRPSIIGDNRGIAKCGFTLHHPPTEPAEVYYRFSVLNSLKNTLYVIR